jgi:hypothetical protein
MGVITKKHAQNAILWRPLPMQMLPSLQLRAITPEWDKSPFELPSLNLN